MPRGQSKSSHTFSGRVSAVRRPEVCPGLPSPDPREVMAQCVRDFASAWFDGDHQGMLHALHPDYVHRLVGIDGKGEPGPGARGLVKDAVGCQGNLGGATPPERRRLDVRILDVRRHSASAVAVLGDWTLQVHLARCGPRWCIVNVMWEMCQA